MIPQIFNSQVEISLRILIILSQSHNSLDKERILISDFLTIYAKDYNLGNFNLHGDNQYKKLELTARRMQISNALKTSVISGYIKFNPNNHGFTYTITSLGRSILRNLKDDLYFKKYNSLNKQIQKYTKDKTTTELFLFIDNPQNQNTL